MADGIDVITTVNISNLESMGDIVAAITGSRRRRDGPGFGRARRGPDRARRYEPRGAASAAARTGTCIHPTESTPRSPTCFARRCSANSRQLTLLWLADRVEEQLEQQSSTDVPDETRGVRERVVVALGGQGGDHLVRRAARIAGRTGAHLVGVHVVSPGESPGPDLERQRALAGRPRRRLPRDHR